MRDCAREINVKYGMRFVHGNMLAKDEYTADQMQSRMSGKYIVKGKQLPACVGECLPTVSLLLVGLSI